MPSCRRIRRFVGDRSKSELGERLDIGFEPRDDPVGMLSRGMKYDNGSGSRGARRVEVESRVMVVDDRGCFVTNQNANSHKSCEPVIRSNKYKAHKIQQNN